MLENVVTNFKYCRKILILVHNVGHWHLMEVHFEDKEFRDYNSLREYMKDQELARWVRLLVLDLSYILVMKDQELARWVRLFNLFNSGKIHY